MESRWRIAGFLRNESSGVRIELQLISLLIALTSQCQQQLVTLTQNLCDRGFANLFGFGIGIGRVDLHLIGDEFVAVRHFELCQKVLRDVKRDGSVRPNQQQHVRFSLFFVEPRPGRS